MEEMLFISLLISDEILISNMHFIVSNFDE